MNGINSDSIRRSITSLDFDAALANAAKLDPVALAQRVVLVYRAIRPLFGALAVSPLLPPSFHRPVKATLDLLDLWAATVPEAGADFRAGKDL